MRQWLPFPVISAMLLGTWLLLNESFSVGQILLARQRSRHCWIMDSGAPRCATAALQAALDHHAARSSKSSSI
jgi:hypothetical protein